MKCISRRGPTQPHSTPTHPPRQTKVPTFTNAPAGCGCAVAVPLVGEVASAEISLRLLGATGGGEGGVRRNPLAGVLNCSALLPGVLWPRLSTPTTVTWYCSSNRGIKQHMEA